MRATALFDRFLSQENFLAACRRVANKGASGGIDLVSADEFLSDDRRLESLRASLQQGTYVPEPVSALRVPKFGHEGGYRELGLPTVADKVVQTALLQVVEPLAERLFLDTSYGYRPGKGAVKALRRVEHFLTNRKLSWVVTQDIDNFFDTLKHERLLSLFAQLVRGDQRLVDLVALWCKMGIVQKDRRWRTVLTGVRQGQVISPLLANLYLHDLDCFVRERNWGWVRYADDFLLLCNDRHEAEKADRAVSDFIDSIHLSLNPQPEAVRSLAQGFDFLGIRFQDTSRHIAPDKLAKMVRMVDWQLSPKAGFDMASIMKKLTSTVSGWCHYYVFLAPWKEFAQLNAQIECNIRQLFSDRNRSGQLKREDIVDLALPRLPDCEAVAARGVTTSPLLPLWDNVNTTNCAQHPSPHIAKQIRKRRKEYTRKEVAGSELVVVTPGVFLGKRGERVIVRDKQSLLSEIPIVRLRTISVAGRGVSLSCDVVRLCAERGISLTFFDDLGKPYAVAKAPEGVDAELVLRQLEHRDGDIGLSLARLFVWGKMKNQLALLKSYGKYHSNRNSTFARLFADNHEAMRHLIAEAKSLHQEKDAESFRQRLMGLEGRFATCYWRIIGEMLPPEYHFLGRIHQGATDLVNVMLNYGYGILYNQTLQAVTKSGLNATVGFLHACQSGRSSLVFDMVEEFRAVAVDRAVFSLINRHEKLHLDSDHLLVPDSRKKLVEAVMTRLGSLVQLHGAQCSLRDCIYHQARAVRDFLTGGCVYRPYLARW